MFCDNIAEVDTNERRNTNQSFDICVVAMLFVTQRVMPEVQQLFQQDGAGSVSDSSSRL